MVRGGKEDGSGGRRSGRQKAMGKKETVVEAIPGLNWNSPAPFLIKTYKMVDDPATDAIVSWGPGNNNFIHCLGPARVREGSPSQALQAQ